MIYAPLKYAYRYKGLSPRMDAALDFLMHTDFSALADGRHELKGDKLYVNVMTYETQEENRTPEHHKHYADIQCVLEGREVISVLPMEKAGALVKSMEEADCYLYEGVGQAVTLQAGEFMVVFPEDVHAPGVSPTGKPEKVRKAVVKVCLD